MRALQVTNPRSFQLVHLPVPHLGSSNVDRILVRTNYVSMCGSDIPFFTGSKRFQAYPLPPGAPIHECTGQVVESTSGLFQPGDHVVAIPEGDQGLAEFFVAQAIKAVRLPPELSDYDASCLIQPLSTVMNTIDRIGRIKGQSVTVVGLGSLGLLFCWLLKKRGAGQIVGIDPCAHRCRMAEELGATRTFPVRSIEVVHAVRQKASEWEPPEVCIEVVGHQVDTINDCLELVRKEGTVAAFGVPDQPVYAIEHETFFRKNGRLIAVVTPVWSKYLREACDLFLACHEELATLISHRFPMRDAEKAFTLYERHEDGIIKALLDTTSW